MQELRGAGSTRIVSAGQYKVMPGPETVPSGLVPYQIIC